MAKPLDPNTPAAPGTPGSPGGGNGDNARIDRDMTPLASNQKINYAALTAIGGVALLFVMWWAGAFSTEQSETKEKTQPLQTQAAPPLPRPPPRLCQNLSPTHPPPPSRSLTRWQPSGKDCCCSRSGAYRNKCLSAGAPKC